MIILVTFIAFLALLAIFDEGAFDAYAELDAENRALRRQVAELRTELAAAQDDPWHDGYIPVIEPHRRVPATIHITEVRKGPIVALPPDYFEDDDWDDDTPEDSEALLKWSGSQ